jgi:hypothetical protein
MNQEYYNYAIKLLDNTSPAELKAKLKEHGFEVKILHRGKKLSEVPFDDVWVGMEVLSVHGDVRKVTDVRAFKEPGQENCIEIKSANPFFQLILYLPQSKFDNYTVK